ncbi:unnamed protein product [Alopecurus aequalis]
MKFYDVWTRQQAQDLAPPPRLITEEDRQRPREIEHRLLVDEHDERSMVEWCARFLEDVTAERAFWEQRRAERVARHQDKRRRKAIVEAHLADPTSVDKAMPTKEGLPNLAMGSSSTGSRGSAGFATQANALLRKNLCFQKRNLKTNVCIALFPAFVCVLLVLLQALIDGSIDKAKYSCGCACVDTAADGSCRRTECGPQYSTKSQAPYCPIPIPPRWPALVQVPPPQSRAVRTTSQPFGDLPEPTCRDTGSCPAVFLVTGTNRSLVQRLSWDRDSQPAPRVRIPRQQMANQGAGGGNGSGGANARFQGPGDPGASSSNNQGRNFNQQNNRAVGYDYPNARGGGGNDYGGFNGAAGRVEPNGGRQGYNNGGFGGGFNGGGQGGFQGGGHGRFNGFHPGSGGDGFVGEDYGYQNRRRFEFRGHRGGGYERRFRNNGYDGGHGRRVVPPRRNEVVADPADVRPVAPVQPIGQQQIGQHLPTVVAPTVTQAAPVPMGQSQQVAGHQVTAPSTQSSAPAKAAKKKEKSADKLKCFNCGVVGHFSVDCTAILCDYCESADHVNDVCPLHSAPKPVIKVLGYAHEELMVLDVPHSTSFRPRSDSGRMGRIKVTGGSLSTEAIVDQLRWVVMDDDFPWDVQPIGGNVYKTQFPSKMELIRATRFGKVDVKNREGYRVSIEIEEATGLHADEDHDMPQAPDGHDGDRKGDKKDDSKDDTDREGKGGNINDDQKDYASVINDELFKGFRQQGGSGGGKSNEFVAGYDFLNTNKDSLDISIWYNSTYENKGAYSRIKLIRVPRLLNMASNAYIKFLRGTGVGMLLEYVREMPNGGTHLKFEIASVLGQVFFTWIIELLFPVILTYLVYEKQQKLKIMMKMHGLKDGPYWIISYVYFFALSAVYMIWLVFFGSLIGLRFFTANDYSIQFVFYLIYINLQIALAFFASSFFSSVKIATVVAYIYIFGSGLLGEVFMKIIIEDTSFPKGWIVVIEIIPGFSLYRGLFELSAFSENATGTQGMKWANLSDPVNGMRTVLIIMVVEWAILLPLAFYWDQVSVLGGGLRKRFLIFFKCFEKRAVSFRSYSFGLVPKVIVEMENPDTTQEREVVEHLLLEPNGNHAVICDNVRKVYHGMDGNRDKLAVRGLSLALPKGQCFGMLGPNGAGKITMMIGLIPPTSGTAYVHGMDIRTDMNDIYANMGVCPQHDLLWETLTGKEHLLFYGRLKNLKGPELLKATDDSLKSVNLFHGGVGNKQVRMYSGGMKRRLSVAISLIGDPKVVFMDEPSTGLDPASRNNLWSVLKEAKENRAIVLTTHSMEEAEVLCDRVGIFVDGGFRCIANPKELKARYGGTYIFTMTTSSEHEHEVEQLVNQLSQRANRIYHISGTQKFELPKQGVRIADVFREVESAKRRFCIHAWGLADTTLEDVFIKVAKGAEVFSA